MAYSRQLDCFGKKENDDQIRTIENVAKCVIEKIKKNDARYKKKTVTKKKLWEKKEKVGKKGIEGLPLDQMVIQCRQEAADREMP